MKRVLCLLMIVLSVATVFANGQEEGTASGAAVNVNPTGYPIASAPLSYDITAIQVAWGRNWGEMPLFQQYEELSGIKINWTMIPESEKVEKTNLMLATANYPDVFMGDLGVKTDETILEGVILPIDGYIEQWAPNMQAFFNAVPEVKAAATFPDGRIYGFMSYHNTSYHTSVSNKYFVNLQWLDNLGLDVPTTSEEFYQVLKAFKEQDANGNGKNDETPFALYTTNQGKIDFWIQLMGSWGVTDKNIVENGKVLWGFEQEGFREGARFFRRLYLDGLLDHESIAQTRDQMRAKAIVDGEVVLGCSASLAPQFIWNDMNIVFKYDDKLRTLESMDDLKPNPERQIGIIPPLAGPDGTNFVRVVQGNGLNLNKAFIFKDCPTPEAMVRWFDYWYDGDKNGFSMKEGPEGIRWEHNVDSGTYFEYMPPEDLGMNLQEWRSWHTPISTFFWDREGVVKKPVLPRHIMLEEYTDAYLEHVPEETFPENLVKAMESEIDILTQYEEELLSYVWESMAKFIFSDIDIDEEWPKFLAQCKKMKSEELLAVKQAQYDRYVSALK